MATVPLHYQMFSGNLSKSSVTAGKAQQVVDFSYNSIEAAFAETYSVRARDLGRFRARLTFLQKGGLLGVSPGKGKPLRYTPDLIHRMLFAVELAEWGVMPAETLGTVADLWESRIRRIFERAEKAAMAPSGPDDIVLMLASTSLTVGAWTSTAKAMPNVNGFPLHRLAGNLDLLMRYGDPPPRAMVVNLSLRLRAFHAALVKAHDLREPVAGAPKRGKTK